MRRTPARDREEGHPLSAAWLSAAQAAQHLGLPSTGALYKRVERGQVPAYRLGRQFRFKRCDLDALMAPSPRAAVGSPAVSAAAGGEIR